MRVDSPMPVTIVGAGPYGLSLSAHLRAMAVPHRILGSPMGTWRSMPRGMFLRSEGFASSLSDPFGMWSLGRFCRDHGHDYGDLGKPVPLDTYLAYGDWFQKALVPDLDERMVRRLAPVRGGFELELDDGETLRSRRVVVACGTAPFASIPEPLRSLPDDRVSHTSHHRDLSEFRDREVTVVGGGQSALETAALLHEEGARVQMLVRAERVLWNPDPEPVRSLATRVREPIAGLGNGWSCWFYSNAPGAFRHLPAPARTEIVGRALGPSGAWWLHDRVMGRVPIHLGREVREATAENGGVRLRLARRGGGTEEIRTEHVIAGTGFPVDVTRLGFIDPALAAGLARRRGAPILSKDFESSVHGLHFIGLAAASTFGPACRFVHGARFTARRLTGHLVAERR
jgi:pyridine nucleotide-disulfide oxidoreductase